MGYASFCFGVVRVLARQLWSSSEWLYMVHRPSWLNVVTLEGKKYRCFEDIESSILDLKLFFFRTLLDWLFALQNKSFPSFFDFLDSCNFRF